MGARIIYGQLREAVAGGLTGSSIYLDFPSVGATEKPAHGRLPGPQHDCENAAEEPEIVDLVNF